MSSRPSAGAMAEANAVAMPKKPMPSAKRGLQMTSEATVAVVELEKLSAAPWTIRNTSATESIGTAT